MISDHTHRYLQEEQHLPGSIINRSTLAEWQNSGSKTLKEREHDQIEVLIKNYQETTLSEDKKTELVKLMKFEGMKFVEELPII